MRRYEVWVEREEGGGPERQTAEVFSTLHTPLYCTVQVVTQHLNHSTVSAADLPGKCVAAALQSITVTAG